MKNNSNIMLNEPDFCKKCGHSKYDHDSGFTLLPSINCKTFLKNDVCFRYNVDNVKDYHFKINIEFDCRRYNSDLQHADMNDLKREIEIITRKILREHSFNFKISLEQAKQIEISRERNCVECGTRLELWSEDFYTDSTHWYCPKCETGMQ